MKWTNIESENQVRGSIAIKALNKFESVERHIQDSWCQTSLHKL